MVLQVCAPSTACTVTSVGPRVCSFHCSFPSGLSRMCRGAGMHHFRSDVSVSSTISSRSRSICWRPIARCCLSCPIAVCMHVHKLRRCSDFDQALCTRSAFQVSHNTLQIHFVALSWTRNLSCCFLHAAHDVCSFLAHVQQFSHNCSVHCSSFTFQLNE